MEHETFWTLLKDSAHWEFEIFLMILFDGLIGAIMWPAIKHLLKDHNQIHMSKNWIQNAVKHPGALHKEMGVPKGQKIPASKLAAAAKKGGKEGERARLAMTFKKMHNK